MIFLLITILSSISTGSELGQTTPTAQVRGEFFEDWRSRQRVVGKILLDGSWIESDEAVATIIDYQEIENARLSDMVKQGRSAKHEWGEDYVQFYAFELGSALEMILKTRPTRRAIEVGSRTAFNIGSAFAALLAQKGTPWPEVFTALTAADDEGTQGKAASVLRFMLAHEANRARLSNANRILISKTLIGLSKSHAPAIRLEAAKGLAGSDLPEAVAVLVRLAESDSESPVGHGMSVREAAQEALARIRARKVK